MKRSPSRSLWLTLSLCLLAVMLLLHATTPTSAAPDGMRAAWERARQAGAYRFSADILQTTIPLPTVTNVGRQSQQDALYVEGQTNLSDATLELTVWSQGGSLFRAEDGLQVRIEDGRAWARLGAGAWEEIDDFSGLFAPQGDALAYLVAARDVVEEGTETRAGFSFTRYTFQVDGRRFAAYMRDQLEHQMAERGELPPGATVELPRLYAEMTGQGELWVGKDGLPLRQILHLRFPENEGERVEADVDISFSGFGARIVQTLPGSLIARLSSRRTLGQAGVLAAMLVLMTFATILRRSKKVYVALILVVILSMVVTPLLQSVRAAALVNRQAARAREQEQRLEEAQWARDMEERLWTSQVQSVTASPDALALIRADDGADSDHDGRTDVQELLLGTDLFKFEEGTTDLDFVQDSAAPEEDADTDSDGLTDDEEEFLGSDASLVDTDADGLTDYEEVLLGTSPLFADSDGDLITDTLELTGYVYTSTTDTGAITTTFYSDPLAPDTNWDGIADWSEWYAGGDGKRPADTDGDGVPDIVDRDNDGDGVPDGLDLSPFQTSGEGRVFDGENPFSLIVDNLETGKPTYVEFQLRPTDPDHLWYAFNVLDWPEDRQGQIQDGDGVTYGDLYPSAVDNASAKTNNNGDVKLVPMLEIVVPRGSENLPPESTLQRLYGVYVQDMAELGMDPGKILYVPLQLVSDSVGGARVAFTGKMLYLPGESWAEAHQVRLVWVVQALLDVCKEGGWQDGQCNEYDPAASNQPQVIQRYDDEWYLTGLNVREDHGQEVGIIWEDPASDTARNDDDALVLLSQVLDKTFLSGRDCDTLSTDRRCQGDGERDITVGELSRRLGQTGNEQERWNLPDILAMETFTYTHQDEALMALVLTDTQRILTDTFRAHWSTQRPITPTLLIVREEEFRAGNLDALAAGEGLSADTCLCADTGPDSGTEQSGAGGGGAEECGCTEPVAWGGEKGHQLTVDMGAGDIQPITMASVTWKPYRYVEGEGWKNCPPAIYWAELERRYLGRFRKGNDEDEALAKLFLFQTYFMTAYAGVSEIVQTGDAVLQPFEAPELSADVAVWQQISSNAGSAVQSLVRNLDASASYYGDVFQELVGRKGLYSLPAKDMTPEAVKAMGEIDRLRAESGTGRARSNAISGRDSIPDQPLKAEKGGGIAAATKIALVLTAINTGLLLAASFTDVEAVEIAATVSTYALAGVGMILTVIDVGKTICKVYTMVKSGISVGKALCASSAVAGASKAAGVVGLVISIALSVTFFVIGLVQGLGAGINSVEIHLMVAQLVAQVIMAVFMFVLAATIVGAILVAIIAIFDTIMSLVGLEEYTTAALLAKALYGYAMIAEPNCALGDSTRTFIGPGRGIVGGKEMVLTQTITATATMKNPSDFRAIPYVPTLWTEGILRDSQVRCELGKQGQDLSASSTAWQRVESDHTYLGWNMRRAEADASANVTLPLATGINYTPALYLNMGYRLPVANCWWVGLLIPPICYATWIEDSHSTDLGALMPIDVLPATIGEFVKWPDLGQQRDRDGDGLRDVAVNGNDPNDSTWDADGDGLSDSYELQRSSREGSEGGSRPSALSADTDGDGLSDADEIRLGTFPNKRDSDGDGLKDSEEVFYYDVNEKAWRGGWTYKYTFTNAQGGTETETIRVTSDPLSADTDGDGVNDGVERALGENPRVWTPNPQRLRVEISDADGIVAPGQTLPYTATVENRIRMDPGYFLTGTLTATLPSGLGDDVLTRAYNLYQGESVSVVQAMIVADKATSGEVAIVSQARGWMHDGYLTDTYRLDPDPAGLLTSTPLATPAYANIAASPGGAALFAVASAEGAEAVNLRSANRVFSQPADVRGDQGCGPGVRAEAPGVACADNGNCLTTWSNVHYDYNCTDIDVFRIKALSQWDGDNEGDRKGDYYLLVNGTKYPPNQEWYRVDYWVLTTGTRHRLDITKRFCGQVSLEIKDYDTWSADDSLGTYSVSYCSAGEGNHVFGTEQGGQGQVQLWWRVAEKPKDGIYAREVTSTRTGTAVSGGTLNLSGPDWETGRQRPAVAANGTDFLVVWQEPGESGGQAIYARPVFNDGTAGATIRLDDPGPGNDTKPAVAWAGNDRYVVVWQSAAVDGIQMAYVDHGGQYVEGSRQALAYGPSEAQVAGSPDTGQALVVYAQACDSGPCIKGRLVDLASGASLTETLGAEIKLVDGVLSSTAPAVAYEPRYGGWLVSWLATGNTLHYLPLSAAGEPLLVKQGRGPQATFQTISGMVPIGGGVLSQAIACSSETTDFAQCDLVASSRDRLTLQPLFLELVPALVGPIATTLVTSVTIDADPPTSTVTSLTDGQSLAVSGTLVIGGNAADPTSGVAHVEISVNGGPWQIAEGAESWVYAWQVPATDGPVTLSTGATDLVGHRGPVSTTTVTIDRTPPEVDLAAGEFVSATLQAGQWSLSLGGTTSDRYSDVESVDVLVTPNGNGWQPATIQTDTWRLDYALSGLRSDGSLLADASGTYTVEVKAVDEAGNETSSPVVRTLRVDAAPPEVIVTFPTTQTAAITTTVTLSGTIADPGPVAAGLGSLAVSFTPGGGSPTRWLTATLDSQGPGVTGAGWQLPVPGDLEGMYQIDLRATDALGNSSDNPANWDQWRGEIDTLAPRAAITATLRGAGHATQTVYEGWVEDLNLSLEGFDLPCEIESADVHYYDDPWWTETTGDTRRLYRLTPSCITSGFPEDVPSLSACDGHGHCTAVAGSLSGEPVGLASAVLAPAHGTVLTSTNPISLTIGAFALAGLDALTLSIGSVEERSFDWAGRLTDTITTTAWTPPGDGRYALVTTASDVSGTMQADPQPITITVDAEEPSVALSTTVLTTSHWLSFRRVALSGSARDAVGLEEVSVSVDGGDWQAARFDGEAWRYPWSLGPGDRDPDGETHTVSVRAIDLAERRVEVSEPVTVDLVPPAPVTLTLAYEGGGGPVPVAIGQPIHEVSATLIMSWTESSDGAGPVAYLAGWSPVITPVAQTLAPAVGEYRKVLSGTQVLYAHLLVRDANGNSRVQTAGPVYLDARGTPDLIDDLDHHGWMDSGCTQIGADREMARHVQAGATLTGTQRLHASWDHKALRLTWTGADWNVSGDLFVYLDTGPGGAATAYDPYGQGPAIGLPDGMGADCLVWVEDGGTAALLTWNGTGWSDPANGELDETQFRLDAGWSRTDLLLPFAQLGLDPGAPVSLVALASEEDALRLWAAMPDENPLNSELAVNPLALDTLGLDFALTQRYQWSSLGDGQCPNQGRFTDADLRVSLGAEPAGLELGFLEHDLPGLLIPGRPLDANLDGEPDVPLPVASPSVPLGHGHTVTYTLRYENLGADVEPGAVVTLTALGALELAGGPVVTVPLDAVSGTLLITGTVDAALDRESAELDAVVGGATHGAFDWLWVQHGVDPEPPTGLHLLAPVAYVRPGPNQASGLVSDPSGVPTITLEVQPGETITCTDTTPHDGTWACTWDAGSAGDETTVRLRVRATDRFGATSDWTAPVTLTVDSTPPTVTLSSETEVALRQKALLGPDTQWFSGQLKDNGQPSSVQVCVPAPEAGVPYCESVATTPGATPGTADWRVRAPVAPGSDGVTQTFSFYGYDSVGNRSEPLMATAQVDLVAPTVVATSVVSRVVQGLSTIVLAGTVDGGSGVARLKAYVAGPGLQVTWYDQDDPELRFDGRAWQFDVRFDKPGTYSLGLEAWDLAGNVGRRGPFPVEVLRPAANLSLALLASPESAVGGLPLGYTARVTNAGPQSASTTVLTFTLPAEVRLLRAPRRCAPDSDSLVCSLGDLASGQSASISLSVDVPIEITRTLVCHATVSSGTFDPDLGNNRRRLLTPVQTYPPDAELVCDGPNLLANGDFEQGFQPNGVARSWTAFDNGEGANYEFRGDAWNRAVSHGAHSQLIEINTFGLHVPARTDRIGGIYQKVRLRPGYAYEVSFDALMRERDPHPDDDPYRFMVGWGYSGGSGTDQARMDFREWLPVHNIYPMFQPGGMQSHSKRFEASAEEGTIWLYATKKWATEGQELNVNLDNVALRICRPVLTGGAAPPR